MTTTSFIRNELILGERLYSARNSRRAKEQLFEIRDRMEKVLYEYDKSEEAYSRLEVGAKERAAAEKGRQSEILEHIVEYKEACSQRSEVLTALNFFFSSYCEPSAKEDEYGEPAQVAACDIIFNNIYHIDFGNDFDDAYVSAKSALERLKFLNSQIVSLATQILNKKRTLEGKGSEFLEAEDCTNRACCRATLDAAQGEYERLLIEMEAKVAMNSRLKKYVLNQEEAVEVCQSIARRLAVDNAHMLASLTSSLKDVRSLSHELEKCAQMGRELKEKYKLPPNEGNVNTDHEIGARNLRSYRDLKKYEHNVREIEQDFSRLEQLSKLLDTMKVQLHKASRRKELTEEQFRGRIAKLHSDVTDDGKQGFLKTRNREENGDAKKGKKRKKKKSTKKSTKSGTFSSTTTIGTVGDELESVVSEEGDSAVLSPVSNISGISESIEHCSLRKEFLSIGKEKKDKTVSVASSDNVFLNNSSTNNEFRRSESRMRESVEPYPKKEDEVVTALQSHSSPTSLHSHSSPTITANDPLFSKVLRASDSCIAQPGQLP